MELEQLYIKGFNHGYILAEHEPELAKQLVKTTKSENSYFKGIVSGKQEYDIEKIRDKLNSSKASPNKTKNIGREK